MGVQESPAWLKERAEALKKPGRGIDAVVSTIRQRWPLFVYMIVLMTAFNSFSHGTQDLYPSGFLGKQRGLPLATISNITDRGLHRGDHRGILLWKSLSQRFGRRRTIAAAALLSLPLIPLLG